MSRPIKWFVKESDSYIGRSWPEGSVTRLKNKPYAMSYPEALRLLAEWSDAGHRGRLVRVRSVEREDIVQALKNTIEAYERANVYRIDAETEFNEPVRVLDDYRVAEARSILKSALK